MGRASVRRSLGLATAALAAFLSAGCGPRQARLVPAEGVLTIAGRPAGDIVVQFLPDDVPDEQRPTSFAVTDAEGKFTLATYDGDVGAVEGGHSVLLVDATEERSAQGEAPRSRSRLNPKYTTVAGGLRATVAAGGGTITIDVPKP